jgi:TonB family protein
MKALESWILTYLLNSLWQVPLLFLAGWTVARAARPLGAQAEHRVWVTTLLLQSSLPAFSALPWDWIAAQFAWRWHSASLRPNGAQVTVQMGAGAMTGAFNLPASMLAASALAYVAVSAYFVARFLWRWKSLSDLRRAAKEFSLTGEARLFLERCEERFGIEDVQFASSTRIFGPLTMGFRKALVLLPAGMASGLADAEMRTLIAHECAHLRRKDFLKNSIYELISLPISYHPLLQLTRERILESREIVCDQMAAEIDGRSPYARSLLRLAARLVEGMSPRTPHAIGIFDANTFERRIMKLTEKQSEMRGLRHLAVVAVCSTFAIGICGSAVALGMHVDAAAKDDSSQSKTPKTVNVAPGVMAAQLLTKTVPKYPDDAKKARIQGKVLLNAEIGKDGTVEKLEVVSGPSELKQSSLDAVRQWTYKPFLLNGEPVNVKTTITVIYTLAPLKK